MIIIDENKLKYDTLYNILNDLSIGEKTKELTLNYNEDWVKNRDEFFNKIEKDEDYSQEDIELVKKSYEIVGNGIDKYAYVDYWIDNIKWYNLSNDKMIDLAEDLVDVIHEEYRDKNESLKDIGEILRILEVMREGLKEN